jgi:peptide/nickel transport system ATP-binding protein
MIVKNLYAYYVARHGLEVKAVDGISLSVDEDEVFGIVGESGCGKSTLASVMSLTAGRTLKVKGGEILLDGQRLPLEEQTEVPRDWHGEKVALLPQRAMNSLNPTARVRDIVVDVVRAHHPGTRPREALQQARERLEQLSLPVRVLDSYSHQLSGGMRQRTVAAISTMLNPKVLIADEPTSALDVSSQKQFVVFIQQLLERGFITRIVYITHDLPLLSNIADRVAVMYAGKIVEVGTTEEIINHPKHPYTQALIASTLDLDLRVRARRIEGIPGAPPDLRYPPSGCRFHPRCPYVMDVCSREEPSVVGVDECFAACWWAQEQSEKVSFKETEP